MNVSKLTAVCSLLVGALGATGTGCSDSAGALSDGDALRNSRPCGCDDRAASAPTSPASDGAGSAGPVAGGGPEPAGTAPAEAAGAVNSIGTVVADMRLKNDFVLRGYESYEYGWYVGPGETQMGNDPSFSNAPVWSEYHDNPAYAGVVAKAILPWVVIFDGIGHAATNTAVELRNMRTYVKSRATGAWTSLGGPTAVAGVYYGKPSTGLPALSDVVLGATSTHATIQLHESSGYLWHGWWNEGRVAIQPNDLDAVFVTVQARTVLADPTRQDDRAAAQLGLQVGADYYLDTSTTYKEGYAPAIGISRTKKLTEAWQAFSFTTLSDVGAQNPGGGISEAALRALPPPLE